jgi:hypothetical protein
LAADWSEDASSRSIARINGTEIVIAAENRTLDEVSSQAIASVGVAFVVLSKSLQVIFSSVDASLNSIASFFGARIDIGTSHRSMSTLSASNIARINGTCIVVVTIFSVMFASSSGGIARVCSAWIVVITVLWISVNTVLAVTSRDSARIWRRRNSDWSVDAISGGLVTCISGTCIVIVTNDWSIDASGGWRASINGACISIGANVVGVSASSSCIARVISAWIAVITANFSVLALSRCGVAAIGCAEIAVITVDVFGVKTFVNGAKPNLAFVYACCILCNKINWGVNTSGCWAASIGCAWVVVITRHCIVVNDTGCGVAVVFGACIIVINRFEGKDASVARIASIDSARIAVIASDRSGDTSFNNIARVFGTFVCISARNWSVNALSRVAVASISGTCIVVIAVNISVEAFSGAYVARNSLAVLVLANNWSEDTLSV